MDIQDFVVNRDQHMRPLEYDLSENFNELVRYLNDVGVLDNIPVGATSESEVVSVSDAYPAPPRALDVHGKSTQDGTPTPDAPVPILSVDELALVMCGKNLLNLSAEHDVNKYYNSTGAEGNNSGWGVFYVPCLGGKSYTLSGMNVENATRIVLVQEKGASGAVIGTGNTVLTAITVTPSTDGLLAINLRISGTNTELDNNIQLELGSTTTVYEPYIGTTVPDLLPEGASLRSLPDGTRDTLSLSYLRPSTLAGWAWYSRELVQRVYELEVDPTWSFGQSNAGGSSDRFDLSRTNKWPECRANVGLFNRFQYSDLNSNAWGYASIRNTNWLVFNNGDQHFSDVTAFKAWLAENPVTVLYPLATPITTQLDPIELPTLPAPNCTVWCDGGSAQPTIVLEYVRDANAVMAELGEAIADIVSG